MIHTDGRRTIANAGPVPGVDLDTRVEQLARDVAAAYAVTFEEALRILRAGARLGLDLAAELLRDDTALD